MTVETDRIYPAWSLGDRIRKARDIADMNQHDFAVAIGVPDGSLANWETDRAKPRDIVAVAKRIEMLTRIPAGWVLGIENSPDGGGGGGGIHQDGTNRRQIELIQERRSRQPRELQLVPADSQSEIPAA